MKFISKSVFIGGLLSLIILQSCKKAVYHQLEEGQVEWLVYKKNDLIVFATTGSKVDTYYVSNRIRGYTGDKHNYNEVASVGFYMIGDTLLENVYGNITVGKDNKDAFEASYVFPHFPDKIILTNMTPVPIDTINGIPVENVYISESDSSSFSANTCIRKVYYTREAGFIKLEDIYGNSWYKIN